MKNMQKLMKTRVRVMQSKSLTSSAVYSVCSEVFAFRTRVTHPAHMKTSAVPSYFQMNFSPKIAVDKIKVATMLLAEFAAMRVKSRNYMK